jgi:hypothetical protein
MPHGKFLLHHVSQSKTIWTWKLDILNYFKIIVKLFEIIKNWNTWQHIICSHCSEKNCILLTNDNMHMVS